MSIRAADFERSQKHFFVLSLIPGELLCLNLQFKVDSNVWIQEVIKSAEPEPQSSRIGTR